MKISVCVPTWQRFEFTTKCFEQVLDDQRIDEFVISDDNSTDGSYEKLLEYYENNPKVKLYKNEQRGKVHVNKMKSIFYAKNDWCILFDSDNTLTKSYIDRLYELNWEEDTAYQPSFAMPNFDYRHLVGVYDKGNIKEHINKPLFECMLNTQNFFINKNRYLDTWEDSFEINGADSIFFNYLWLRKNKIHVVDNLHYEHLVHRGSFYESVAEDSLPKSLQIVEKIKSL